MIDDRSRALLAQPTPPHSTPLHPIHAQCNIICGTEISQEKHAVSEIIAKNKGNDYGSNYGDNSGNNSGNNYIYICRTIDLGASPAFSPNIGAKSKGSLIFDSSASVACCIVVCVGRLNGQGCRPGVKKMDITMGF